MERSSSSGLTPIYCGHGVRKNWNQEPRPGVGRLGGPEQSEPCRDASGQRAPPDLPERLQMRIRNWLRRSRSRRAIGLRAWFGLVLIAGGLLFLTIHLSESARKSAERKPPTSALLPASPEKSWPSVSE